MFSYLFLVSVWLMASAGKANKDYYYYLRSLFCILAFFPTPKPRTPLEEEIFRLLHKTKQPVKEPLLTPYEKASLQAMSLEEVSVCSPPSLSPLCFGSSPASTARSPHFVHFRPSCAGWSSRRLGLCSHTTRLRHAVSGKSRAKSTQHVLHSGHGLWAWIGSPLLWVWLSRGSECLEMHGVLN